MTIEDRADELIKTIKIQVHALLDAMVDEIAEAYDEGYDDGLGADEEDMGLDEDK